MRRPVNCDCHCGCDLSAKTLKAFDKATGSLRWHHWLDNVVLSSDGDTIYGYAYEEDDSAAALACTMVRLAGTGTPVTLGIAATSATRYQKWVRKIDSNGAVLGDSTFFWYTGNGGYTDTPIELPADGAGWMQDFYGASSDGGLLQITGDYTLGTTLGDYLIIWDDNNTTTTRRYTFVAAAVRDLATPPIGGAKIRFIAAYDGTNAEQTIDVGSTIGITAADLATALEAFPHIVSATGTGGPYPLINIDLEIEWAQSATHFKSVQRQSSTSRGVMTWVRDWDTAEITAILAQPSTAVSKASLWQFDASDNIFGIGTNPTTSIGSPAEVGIAVEKFTLSAGAYTQAWRTRPTLDRPPIWGPASGADTSIYYTRPAIRNSQLIVGHYPGRGNDQSVGQHSEWHELNMSTGALSSNGSANNRRVFRPWFASSTKIVAPGWDSFVLDPVGGLGAGYFQCERSGPNFLSLMNAISGVTVDYNGPFGQLFSTTTQTMTADTTAIYCCKGLIANTSASGGSGWSADSQTVLRSTNARMMTVLTRDTIGATSRVSPDAYFSLADYYRIQHFLESPINYHWNETGLQWRVAFFASDTITSSTDASSYTAWLDFADDETDLQAALDTLLGTNDDGANAFVEGPDYPVTAIDTCPQMVWQRGITLIFPANNLAFPAETPPVHYGLNLRDSVRYCRIQLQSAIGELHTLSGGNIIRMDWSTSDVNWDVPFGSSVAGGAEIGGNTGILLGDNYVVSGNRVNGGCICTYVWSTYTSTWALLFADCGLRTATEPSTSGTYDGEVREGICA